MRRPTPLLALSLTFALASAGEPPVADGPALGEMRAAVEARLAPKPEAPPEREAPAALKAAYDRLVEGVEACHGGLYRDRNQVALGDLYADVVKYGKALEAYEKKRKHDPREWFVQSGRLDLRVARVRALQGDFEEAAELAGKVRKETDDEWTLRRAKRTQGLIKNMPEARAREKAALAKLEANPADADAQWTLCDVYRSPVPCKYEEVRALVAMRALFPENGRVAGGECDWRLSEGYWRFGMRAEAFALLEPFRAKYPKHGAVRNGEARWRLAEFRYRAGQYAEAEELYDGFMEKFPEHWVSQDRGHGVRALQRLIECRKRMKR